MSDEWLSPLNALLINRTDNIENKLSPRNTKNRSSIIRDEEPMDVEPVEKISPKKSQDFPSSDTELLDIEDPW